MGLSRENTRQDELGMVYKLRTEGRNRERELYEGKRKEIGNRENKTLPHGQSEQDKGPCC